MGLGVLGQRVAQALQGFEFPVNGWSRTPKALDGVCSFQGAAQFSDFLAASKVLVNLLPLTPDTQNIMNRQTLSQLQPGGYVINVARGAHLVDEDWLAPRWAPVLDPSLNALAQAEATQRVRPRSQAELNKRDF